MFDGLISRCTRPAAMCRFKTVDNLQEQPRRVRHPQRTRPVILDKVEQALARNVLHHHEMHVAFAAHRERAGKIGVETAPRELHLAAKPEQGILFLGGLPRRQHLDRNLFSPVVDGQIDLPHPAFTDGSHQPVPAQEKPPGAPVRSFLAW